MAQIKAGTVKTRNRQGIHLFEPSRRAIEIAKEDADNKGFKYVYVYRTTKLIVK